MLPINQLPLSALVPHNNDVHVCGCCSIAVPACKNGNKAWFRHIEYVEETVSPALCRASQRLGNANHIVPLGRNLRSLSLTHHSHPHSPFESWLQGTVASGIL